MEDEETDSDVTGSEATDSGEGPSTEASSSGDVQSPEDGEQTPDDSTPETDPSADEPAQRNHADRADAPSGSPRYCRDCGASLAPGASFCRECGTPQKSAARAGQQYGGNDPAGQQYGGNGPASPHTGPQHHGGQQYQQHGGPGRAVTAGPDSDTGMAAIAHLLALPLWILGPIIIYAVSDDPFVRQNAAAATNWQIMLAVYSMISLFLALLIIGVFMLFALFVMDLVFIIIAAIKASEGEAWQYPLTPEIL